jgi:hypothetical protein
MATSREGNVVGNAGRWVISADLHRRPLDLDKVPESETTANCALGYLDNSISRGRVAPSLIWQLTRQGIHHLKNNQRIIEAVSSRAVGATLEW